MGHALCVCLSLIEEFMACLISVYVCLGKTLQGRKFFLHECGRIVMHVQVEYSKKWQVLDLVV